MSKNSIQHQPVVATAAAWKGPIPPPAVLNQYNSIVPDAAERILIMAEEEARIRRDQIQKDHDSENRVRESDVNQYHADVKRGQYLAALVMLGIVAAVVVCVVFGKEKAAMAVAGMGAVGIVSSFIGRKK
ncbi:MAG: DUF2335 domain-containing protein [Kiritimatiellae bacterium]|nr:DUF2335 domain-containing protein [Kiritimatiellia bacterium]